MEERLYEVGTEDGFTIQLRIWSVSEFSAGELHELFVWLTIIREDIARLHDATWSDDRLPRLVANWLAVRHGGGGFFVEQSVVAPGEEAADGPDLAMGVMEGRTVMVSTDSLMFIRLQAGLCGLTVAGRGSYLVEDQDELPAVRRA